MFLSVWAKKVCHLQRLGIQVFVRYNLRHWYMWQNKQRAQTENWGPSHLMSKKSVVLFLLLSKLGMKKFVFLVHKSNCSIHRKQGKICVLRNLVFHVNFWVALVILEIDFVVFHSQFLYTTNYPKLIESTLVCYVFFYSCRCFLFVFANEGSFLLKSTSLKYGFDCWMTQPVFPNGMEGENFVSISLVFIVYQTSRSGTVDEFNFETWVWSVNEYKLLSH